MGLIPNSIFCSVGLVIGSEFFKDSKSDINCNLFYASEKILARESIPRLLKINFYEANALPSELAGPGNILTFSHINYKYSYTFYITQCVKHTRSIELE